MTDRKNELPQTLKSTDNAELIGTMLLNNSVPGPVLGLTLWWCFNFHPWLPVCEIKGEQKKTKA